MSEPRSYGQPSQVDPTSSLPPLPPEIAGQPNLAPPPQVGVSEGDNIPTCPLLGEACIMETCAWFNDYTGTCWVPEGMLALKMANRGRRY